MVGNQVQDNKAQGAITSGVRPGCDASTCAKCGARRVDQQLGLEETPQAYVARLVEVFREVRRVLKPTGSVFCNLGDAYSNGGRTTQCPATIGPDIPRSRSQVDLPPKSLLGLPWRVAFALQEDGWILREDIVWAKKNAMPESCRDRCTRSHEMIFHLTKEPRYWWDWYAGREKAKQEGRMRTDPVGGIHTGVRHSEGGRLGETAGRNPRSVWTIGSEPLGAVGGVNHFAAYPSALVRRVLTLACPERVCAECGVPWVREVEKSGGEGFRNSKRYIHTGGFGASNSEEHEHGAEGTGGAYQVRDLGLFPDCGCGADAPTVPGLVLDPFMGSGTTAVAARQLGRDYLGIELSEEYCRMAEERIANYHRKPPRARPEPEAQGRLL